MMLSDHNTESPAVRAPVNRGRQGRLSQQCCLLALPHEVLMHHVWHHLGPWSHAQLRGTCRALRDLADSERHTTISCTVNCPEPTTRAAAQPLLLPLGASKLLASKETKGLAIHLTSTQAVTKRLHVGPHDPHHLKLTPLLQQVHKCSMQRLTSLAVTFPEAPHPSDRVCTYTPILLSAVSAACPSLTHLHLGLSQASAASKSDWQQALVSLPPSLTSLTWSTMGHASKVAVQQLRAARQLSNLKSLTLFWKNEDEPKDGVFVDNLFFDQGSQGEHPNSPQQLQQHQQQPQVPESLLSGLTQLTLSSHCPDLSQILQACSTSLKSLTLGELCEPSALAAMLSHSFHLASLHLPAHELLGQNVQMFSPVFTSLTHLTLTCQHVADFWGILTPEGPALGQGALQAAGGVVADVVAGALGDINIGQVLLDLAQLEGAVAAGVPMLQAGVDVAVVDQAWAAQDIWAAPLEPQTATTGASTTAATAALEASSPTATATESQPAEAEEAQGPRVQLPLLSTLQITNLGFLNLSGEDLGHLLSSNIFDRDRCKLVLQCDIDLTTVTPASSRHLCEQLALHHIAYLPQLYDPSQDTPQIETRFTLQFLQPLDPAHLLPKTAGVLHSGPSGVEGAPQLVGEWGSGTGAASEAAALVSQVFRGLQGVALYGVLPQVLMSQAPAVDLMRDHKPVVVHNKGRLPGLYGLSDPHRSLSTPGLHGSSSGSSSASTPIYTVSNAAVSLVSPVSRPEPQRLTRRQAAAGAPRTEARATPTPPPRPASPMPVPSQGWLVVALAHISTLVLDMAFDAQVITSGAMKRLLAHGNLPSLEVLVLLSAASLASTSNAYASASDRATRHVSPASPASKVGEVVVARGGGGGGRRLRVQLLETRRAEQVLRSFLAAARKVVHDRGGDPDAVQVVWALGAEG